MTAPTLVQRLNAITSVREVAQLQELEAAVCLMDSDALTESECEAIYRLFERFPDDDAFGAFFSLLHKLEAHNGYETELLKSVNRRATEFNIEMVARIIRGGTNVVSGTNLMSVLQHVAQSGGTLPTSRKYAVETLIQLQAP